MEKISQAKAMLEQQGNTGAVIEVDGGVNKETAPLVAAKGATFLVAGSAVFGAADRTAAIAELR